ILYCQYNVSSVFLSLILPLQIYLPGIRCIVHARRCSLPPVRYLSASRHVSSSLSYVPRLSLYCPLLSIFQNIQEGLVYLFHEVRSSVRQIHTQYRLSHHQDASWVSDAASLPLTKYSKTVRVSCTADRSVPDGIDALLQFYSPRIN